MNDWMQAAPGGITAERGDAEPEWFVGADADEVAVRWAEASAIQRGRDPPR